jgi:hypothetical protein
MVLVVSAIGMPAEKEGREERAQTAASVMLFDGSMGTTQCSRKRV